MTTETKNRRGGRRRRNGEGTVFRRMMPSGLVRWDIELRDRDGKRICRRYKTEREAYAALKSAQLRKDVGRSALPVRHTMEQLLTAWLDYLRQQVDRGERSFSTWRGHETYVREHIRPALGKIECRNLTVEQVDDFLASLDLSPQTRANQRATLRRALNVAVKWGWVDQNVVSRSDAIPVPAREVEALSLADAQSLLSALKDSALYSAFVVALYTGLRAGELAGLRVEDIDIKAGTARIHQQVQATPRGLIVKSLKTHASASRLDLIPDVVGVLDDVIGDRANGYVWESAPGYPYWPTSFAHSLAKALKRAGLPHIRLHDLRHYFISFLPQLDIHPAVAQRLARHASIGTTMNVYTSVEDGLKRQAMGRLHDALRNAELDSSPVLATVRSTVHRQRTLRIAR
jgi:integrase